MYIAQIQSIKKSLDENLKKLRCIYAFLEVFWN